MSDENIYGFYGKWRFLSNFYTSPFELEGKRYETVEHYYQACKAKDEQDHEYVRTAPTPGLAKHRGKRIPIREDWDENKIHVMTQGIIAKFEQNPELGEKLARTSPGQLFETNTWGDTYWGVCNGKGCNNLGKVLMFVRETFI